METHNASISREGTPSLILEIKSNKYKISLSEDNPNQIKEVFNNLIKILKKGKFEFIFDDEKEDLYTNICIEYIKQLNSELAIIYSQLKAHELLEE